MAWASAPKSMPRYGAESVGTSLMLAPSVPPFCCCGQTGLVNLLHHTRVVPLRGEVPNIAEHIGVVRCGGTGGSQGRDSLIGYGAVKLNGKDIQEW